MGVGIVRAWGGGGGVAGLGGLTQVCQVHPAVLVNQHVARLNVAVHDAMVVLRCTRVARERGGESES